MATSRFNLCGMKDGGVAHSASITSTDSMCVSQGLKMLRRLYLDGNLLDVVPSDLPPTLQELKISENRLRGVDGNSFQGPDIRLHVTKHSLTNDTKQPPIDRLYTKLCWSS